MIAFEHIFIEIDDCGSKKFIDNLKFGVHV